MKYTVLVKNRVWKAVYKLPQRESDFSETWFQIWRTALCRPNGEITENCLKMCTTATCLIPGWLAGGTKKERLFWR